MANAFAFVRSVLRETSQSTLHFKFSFRVFLVEVGRFEMDKDMEDSCITLHTVSISRGRPGLS